MIMPGLLQVTNFCPLVLRDVVHLALFRGLVWVLGTNCVNEVLGFEFEFAVEVGQLVARPRVVHEGSLLHLIGLFINHVAFVREN